MPGERVIQLQVFNFETSKVRIVQIKGQPWFVATDACKALALDIGKHSAAHYLTRLHASEVCVSSQPLAGKGMYAAKLISESGLYKLIMRSDKPEARRFQDWVTREVLPALRKNGGYVVGQEKLATGEMSEARLRTHKSQHDQRRASGVSTHHRIHT